jgi:hypothetical protein
MPAFVVGSGVLGGCRGVLLLQSFRCGCDFRGRVAKKWARRCRVGRVREDVGSPCCWGPLVVGHNACASCLSRVRRLYSADVLISCWDGGNGDRVGRSFCPSNPIGWALSRVVVEALSCSDGFAFVAPVVGDGRVLLFCV